MSFRDPQPGGGGATVTIAGSNVPASKKAEADYVCVGDYDENVFHRAQLDMIANGYVADIEYIGTPVIRSPIRVFLDGCHVAAAQRGYVGTSTLPSVVATYITDRLSGGPEIRPHSSFTGTHLAIGSPCVPLGTLAAPTVSTATTVALSAGMGAVAQANGFRCAWVGGKLVSFSGVSGDTLTGCLNVPDMPAGTIVLAPLNLMLTIVDKVGSIDSVTSVAAAGAGYSAGQVLNVQGGAFTTRATITVDTVDGAGGVLTAHIDPANVGAYSNLPTSPVNVTGGGGAQFNVVETWALGLTGRDGKTQPISAVAIDQSGSGYAVGDTLTIQGGTVQPGATSATVTVATIDGAGGVTSVALTANVGPYELYHGPGVYGITGYPCATTTSGAGTGCVVTVTMGAVTGGRTSDFPGVACLPSSKLTTDVDPSAWVYNPSGTNAEITWVSVDTVNNRLKGIPASGTGNLPGNVATGTRFWFTQRTLGGADFGPLNVNGLKYGTASKVRASGILWQVNEGLPTDTRVKNCYLYGFEWDGGGHTGFPRSASETTNVAMTIRACQGDSLFMGAAATDSQVIGFQAISPGRCGLVIDGGSGCQFGEARISGAGDYSAILNLRHIQFTILRYVNCQKGIILTGDNVGGGICYVNALGKNVSIAQEGAFDGIMLVPTGPIYGAHLILDLSSSKDLVGDTNAKVRNGISVGNPTSAASSDCFVRNATLEVHGGTTPSGDAGNTHLAWLGDDVYLHPTAGGTTAVDGIQIMGGINSARPETLTPVANAITPHVGKTLGLVPALAAAVTVNAFVGNPIDGATYTFRFRDTNVGGRGITWNASQRGGTTLVLPALTSGSSKTDEVIFRYDLISGKWNLVGLSMGLS